MEFKDYYAVLGIKNDASADDIKRAFRKAARTYHPDVNTSPEAEAKFQEISEAHEVLSDPEKRAAYDGLGRGAPSGGDGFAPPPRWEGGFSFSETNNGDRREFSDFFETLFRSGADPMRGWSADSHRRIEVDLADVFTGAQREVHLRAPEVQPDGSLVMRDRVIAVHIPKGIRAGQHIRLTGQGGQHPGTGEAGDLFLEIAFAPHPVYHSEGSDLHMTRPVAPWEAALGGKVVLPTPAGKVEVTIPANARSGQKLRLKGKGLPGPQAGDLYAKLEIVNPKVSSNTAREVFEKMALAMPFDPRAHLGGE